jgi:hypothetical protein
MDPELRRDEGAERTDPELRGDEGAERTDPELRRAGAEREGVAERTLGEGLRTVPRERSVGGEANRGAPTLVGVLRRLSA